MTFVYNCRFNWKKNSSIPLKNSDPKFPVAIQGDFANAGTETVAADGQAYDGDGSCYGNTKGYGPPLCRNYV
jgi:hypothetical protein